MPKTFKMVFTGFRVVPSPAAFHPPLSRSSKAFLLPLQITPIYFYKQALCLPTSFSISDLARLKLKPRLFRSSWRTFGFTHPLMLFLNSPRTALFAFPFLETHLRLLWSLLFLLHASNRNAKFSITSASS